MLPTILTLLKKMSKILNVPRFYGPLVTVVFTVLYHLGHLYFGYSVTLVWIAVFVVVGSFLSGLRGGLVAALFAVGYAFYAIPMIDRVDRAVQVAAGMVIMAFAVGYLRRRERQQSQRATENEAAAQALGALNGNILRIRHSRNLLLKVLQQHRLDDITQEEIRSVLHVLNNLEMATAGWQELARVKEKLDEQDHLPR